MKFKKTIAPNPDNHKLEIGFKDGITKADVVKINVFFDVNF